MHHNCQNSHPLFDAKVSLLEHHIISMDKHSFSPSTGYAEHCLSRRSKLKLAILILGLHAPI
jgi:hypothetical protein